MWESCDQGTTTKTCRTLIPPVKSLLHSIVNLHTETLSTQNYFNWMFTFSFSFIQHSLGEHMLVHTVAKY